jgi:hypothetical protein
MSSTSVQVLVPVISQTNLYSEKKKCKWLAKSLMMTERRKKGKKKKGKKGKRNKGKKKKRKGKKKMVVGAVDNPKRMKETFYLHQSENRKQCPQGRLEEEVQGKLVEEEKKGEKKGEKKKEKKKEEEEEEEKREEKKKEEEKEDVVKKEKKKKLVMMMLLLLFLFLDPSLLFSLFYLHFQFYTML